MLHYFVFRLRLGQSLHVVRLYVRLIDTQSQRSLLHLPLEKVSNFPYEFAQSTQDFKLQLNLSPRPKILRRSNV